MKKGYSKYLRFLLLFIDSLALLLISSFEEEGAYQSPLFVIYIISFWVVSTAISEYYNIYRFTAKYHIFKLLCIQLAIFFLGFFAYFGIFKEGSVVDNQLVFLVKSGLVLSALKFFFYFLLKRYRASGRNYRNVVFLELDETSKKIIDLFSTKKDLGYIVKGYFSDLIKTKPNYLGTINLFEKYILENEIDEVYATTSNLKEEVLKQFIKFLNKQNVQLKLIPNAIEVYSKNAKEELYNDTFKVLKIDKLPFEYRENRIIKRVFDVVFSSFIIVFIMSWVTPLLWVLIKLESKGSLFFKQERDGFKGEKFVCYKFRSMYKNNVSDAVQATENDERITKIGKFMRKTSIDELPQFYNVFLGDMSIVGPRPHMNVHNRQFSKEIDNYIERNSVKPGITGLAQVRGYRGEIKKKSDIVNRVRLDVFYIENWTFNLDVKIILATLVNLLKGEKNAY